MEPMAEENPGIENRGAALFQEPTENKVLLEGKNEMFSRAMLWTRLHAVNG